MLVHYTYKDKDYGSSWSLRRDIGKDLRVAFSEEPSQKDGQSDSEYLETLKAFWGKFDAVPYEYTPPEPTPPTTEELAAQIRSERDRLLDQTDKYGTIDYPEGELKTAMLKYRQELRDITLQEGFPTSVTWPTMPTKSEGE